MDKPIDIDEGISKLRSWAEYHRIDAQLSGDDNQAGMFLQMVALIDLIGSQRRLNSLLERRITHLESENARLEQLAAGR